jgi:putative PIN family toxin of toxin-antitoxin system
MPKRRCFLDANVIISGLLWNGNERKLLDLGEEKSVALVTSLYVLREVEDVLKEMNFDDDKVDEFIVYLRSFIEMKDATLDDVKRYWDTLEDKSDVPVLAAAIDSKATLVTGDKELLSIGVKFLKVRNAKQVLKIERK